MSVEIISCHSLKFFIFLIEQFSLLIHIKFYEIQYGQGFQELSHHFFCINNHVNRDSF